MIPLKIKRWGDGWTRDAYEKHCGVRRGGPLTILRRWLAFQAGYRPGKPRTVLLVLHDALARVSR